jgi:alkylhydroperoxidase family enzyme
MTRLVRGHFPAWESSRAVWFRRVVDVAGFAGHSPEEPFMQLTIHTLDTAPAESRPILEGIAADLGLVPNLAAVAAASPALLSGFNGLRSAVGATKLDPVLRELTGLTVGVAVDNRYGVAFHSTMLGNLGVDESEIRAVREGRAPTSSSLAAVHALAREIAVGRGKVSDATLARAEGAGLSTVALLEVALEAAFASMVGLIDNLAGHVELDEFLEPRAWK